MLEGAWWASYAALWILVFLEAAAVLALSRQIGRLHLRMGYAGARMTDVGPELDTPAPPFQERGVDGSLVTLGSERNRATLLVFLSPRCPLCEELAPAVRAIFRHEKKGVEIIVISRYPDEAENRTFIRRHQLNGIPYVISPQLTDAYGITSSPHAVLVDATGKVRSKGVANNLEQLESLLNVLLEGYQSYDSKMNSLAGAKGRGA
jgi:methylamine dehydrogenase accessory protein MauD